MSNDDPLLSAACRREYYRLRYPSAHRPRIFLQTQEFIVTELSEKGIRFRAKLHGDKVPFSLTSEIEGTLVLATATIHVTGVIGRRDGDELIVLDVTGVSFQRMLEEQRHLARVFYFGEDFTM